MVLSDIEIANSVSMEPISKVADQLGIDKEALCLYGKYKAKINARQLVALKDKPDGKLILVTAISPTPAGEGKTTTSVGLVDALSAIGKKAVIALREPSLGPVFGVKGGAAGAWMVSIGALISITGLNMGESIMVPRYGAAIADEGLLPAAIAKQNQNGAPLVAILVSGAIAIVLLLTGSFENLAKLSVVFRFFQYIPTALAVMKLRKDAPDANVIFRVPFGPIIPILAVIVSLVMIWGDNPMNFVYGAVGVIIASSVYYLMHGRNHQMDQMPPKEQI